MLARAHMLLDVLAVTGVIVAAIPIFFELQPYYLPLILVGSGIGVLALAIYLYFSTPSARPRS